MPVNLQVGGGEFNWDVRRTKERGFAEAFALEGLALFHKNGQQVCDVLVSGILPRFPGLRVVSVESGIGWLPIALERLAGAAFGQEDVEPLVVVGGCVDDVVVLGVVVWQASSGPIRSGSRK